MWEVIPFNMQSIYVLMCIDNHNTDIDPHIEDNKVPKQILIRGRIIDYDCS